MTDAEARIEVRRVQEPETLGHSNCPVCDAEDATRAFSIEGSAYSIVVCASCGTGRLEPLPSGEEIAAFYPSSYYGDRGSKFNPVIERLVRFFGSRRARRLSRGLPSGARVLDIGCGRGVLLGRLADLGFEVHGTEVSEEAARGADPRAEIRTIGALADAGYPPERFHQVVLWHVLEHLPDPTVTLREIHRVLQPGGRLAIAVPNFASAQARWMGGGWFHLDPPRHIFHFPLSALRRMLSECGFRVVSVSHFSLLQNPYGWVQSVLNNIPGARRDALYSVLKNTGGQQLHPIKRASGMAVFLAGMPVGLVCSVVAAMMRSGATVEIEAQRVP